MGCTSSREARRDRGGGSHPISRSYSLPFMHSSRRVGGSTHQHIVSLTSSTLGSLRLDHPGYGAAVAERDEEDGDDNGRDEAMKKSLNDGVKWVEGKRKGPMTPTVTPPNEPETINTWEMMEGLDDVSPVGPRLTAAAVERSLSFPAAVLPLETTRTAVDAAEAVKVIKEQSSVMEERNGTLIKTSLVKARIHAFQEKINARRAIANAAKEATVATTRSCKFPPSGEGKVVLYFTSLRGVRKTHEDCYETLVILRGYGVRIDERDVSMHSGFKEELYGILGVVSGGLRLPRVFADGRYLGGADEIRQLHESGELLETLRSCTASLAMKGITAVCTGCGDVRFVPCKVCSGSCKVFIDEELESKVEGGDGGAVGFRRCQECNENGLVRCPICCVL